MRLIDADAIPWEGFPNDFGEYHEDYVEKRVVDKMPTIEARPVVRGEWFSLTDCANAGVYCSVCHKKVWKEDYAWCNRKNRLRSNFCPNCGADMRGVENGKT